MDLSCFTPELRVPIYAKDLQWILLDKAIAWAKQICDETEGKKLRRKSEKFVEVEVWKKRKTAAADRLKANDPW